MTYEEFLTVAFRQLVRQNKLTGHSLHEVTAALGIALISSDHQGLAIVQAGRKYYSFRYKGASMSELGFTVISVPEERMKSN